MKLTMLTITESELRKNVYVTLLKIICNQKVLLWSFRFYMSKNDNLFYYSKNEKFGSLVEIVYKKNQYFS